MEFDPQCRLAPSEILARPPFNEMSAELGEVDGPRAPENQIPVGTQCSDAQTELGAIPETAPKPQVTSESETEPKPETTPKPQERQETMESKATPESETTPKPEKEQKPETTLKPETVPPKPPREIAAHKQQTEEHKGEVRAASHVSGKHLAVLYKPGEKVISRIDFKRKNGSVLRAGDVGVVTGPAKAKDRVRVNFPNMEKVDMYPQMFKLA